MHYASKILVVLFWFTSLAIALLSYRFLALGLENSFPDMLGHIADNKLWFTLHIAASPVALPLGLMQFQPRLRDKRPALHRWSGRVYGIAVVVGGLSGLMLAVGSTERPIAALGFGTLAVLWLGTTANAIRLAMLGHLREHRRWMIRSYALTAAAITLRLALPFFFFLGEMDYAQASAYVAWLCWIPNLLLAELYLRLRLSSDPISPILTR